MEIKINLSFLMTIFVLSTLAQSLTIGQYAIYSYQAPSLSSHFLTANEQQFSEYPSQYFMCGFSFRRMRWGAMKWNCDCGRRWYRGKKRYRCNWCMNWFWSMNNGMKIFFCHYKSWNLQTTKTFELPSSEPSQYRQTVMCPPGYYIRTIGGRNGHEEGKNLGLAGLSADCFTANLVEKQHISDNSHFPISSHQNFVIGAFVSAVKLMYIGSKIVGIHVDAEHMPVVTKIQISYLDTLNNETSEVFDQQTVQNQAIDKIEKRISYTKKFPTVSIWNQKTLKTEGYHFQLSPEIKISLPSIDLQKGDSYQFYQSFNDTFNFNKPLMSTFEATQNNLIMIPSCTKIIAKCVVNSQKGSIPFKANVTYSGLLSGATIKVKEIKGIWEGTYTSGTKITVQRSSIPNCRSKNNHGRNNLR